MTIESGAAVVETWFSAEARSAASARRAVRSCLAECDRRVVEEVELLTSELFAQAAAEATGVGRVCVRLQRSRAAVRVEVAREPVTDHADAVQGSRLEECEPVDAVVLDKLLDAFSASWGRTVTGEAEGATWFEMRLGH